MSRSSSRSINSSCASVCEIALAWTLKSVQDDVDSLGVCSGAFKNSPFRHRAHPFWPKAKLKYPLAHVRYRVCQIVGEFGNEVINSQQKRIAFGPGNKLISRRRNSRFSWVVLIKKQD